jgi:hypothetical protein
MRAYVTPMITDHGDVRARTCGLLVTVTLEPVTAGREHRPSAPAGMTFEPVENGSSTYALYSETGGVDVD